MPNFRYGLLYILLLISLPYAHAQNLRDDDCLACHSDKELSKTGAGGKKVSLYVDKDIFGKSVHGGLGCLACHSDVREIPHPEKLTKVDCATCHQDTHEKFMGSLHGKASLAGNPNAPNCAHCHGVHNTLPSSDPKSPTHRSNIPATCGSCHGDLKFIVEQFGEVGIKPFYAYQNSVHGRAIARGELKAAVCTDCHESHNIRSPFDPQSRISKLNIPDTCGRCHTQVKEQYGQSIHWKALQAGITRSPVCSDCHGIHSIKARLDADAPIARQRLTRTTCSQCHEGQKLSEEYGVAAERVTTYLSSYHGLASDLGSLVVANCASCHGVHNILPSTNPKSSIHVSNLEGTCGQCHPGASIKFREMKIHRSFNGKKDVGSKLIYYVRNFYIFLIALVLGAMGLHNGLDFTRKVWGKWRVSGKTYTRMSLNQRVQHFAVLITFFILVITGFAIKYPDSILGLLFKNKEALRGLLHRISGTIFIGLGVYHIAYFALTRKGRRFFKNFSFHRSDLRELADNIRYYLWLREEHPKFGRVNYVEKAEYWALLWGSVIMMLTGVVMWFKMFFIRFSPFWVIDLATTIHFYEAILATLAIVVWHLYYVMFNPDVYPMNWAWLTGQVSEAYMHSEHPMALTSTSAGSQETKEPAGEDENKNQSDQSPDDRRSDDEHEGQITPPE